MALVADLRDRILALDGEVLRTLTLDPNRDYQLLGISPGPKPRPTSPM